MSRSNASTPDSDHDDQLFQSASSARSKRKPTYEFIVEDVELGTEGRTKRKTRLPKSARLLNLGPCALWSIVIGAAVLAVVVLCVLFSNASKAVTAAPAGPTGSTYLTGFNMKQNWGPYSPYFDTGKPFDGISKHALEGINTLPPQCRYRQVHILHRHGDRYPAGGTVQKMENVAKSLKQMKKSPASSLAWIKDWEYTLGADLLVSSGVATEFTSGAKFWGSHGRLLYNATEATAWSADLNVYHNGTSRPLPQIRATTQYRIEESAKAWAAGFFGTYGHPTSGVDPSKQYRLQLQKEVEKTNNSLAGYFGCPNSEKDGASTGGERKKKWVDIYLKTATERLQQLLPGFEDLTPTDVLGMQDICAFETAAYGSSPFCTLFTELEWRGFEYHLDLNFYGESGWGSKVGPATGLPWIRELYARLKNEVVTDTKYGTDSAYDSNTEGFPLDQPFYADFTHDSVIISVLSALGFEWAKHDLPADHMRKPRQFVASRLVPFGARLYVEIIDCEKGKEYVRLKLNDRVLNLSDLKGCPEDESGLCLFKGFVSSLDHVLKSIDFEDVCYGDHDWAAKETDLSKNKRTA